MTRSDSLSHKRAVLGRVLQAFGYDVQDFLLEEAPAPVAESVGLNDRVVTVRRRSTGVERLYVSGPNSFWFGAILGDLARGRFGP
jgi:Zn-dependent M32 family carboxypeptidase